jgi:hypothetical protein
LTHARTVEVGVALQVFHRGAGGDAIAELPAIREVDPALPEVELRIVESHLRPIGGRRLGAGDRQKE